MTLERHKTECPLCGSVIQRTFERWDTGVVWDPENEEVVDYEIYSEGETRIYCGNDHTLEEMTEAWS